MSEEKPNKRLSSIPTQWTVLRQANEGTADEAAAACAQLWARYGDAVRRYLRGIAGDPAVAEDLAQEFAVTLLRGGFSGADPQYGRFRNYVKTVLRNLVCRHRAKEQRRPEPLSPDDPAWGGLAEQDESSFDHAWREELVRRALAALAHAHPESHAVVRFRAEHQKMPSHEMAEPLGRQLGKPLTAAAVRQMLKRARARLWALLREEVAQSLDDATPERIDDELRELDLWSYYQAE
jgi:RNA polymerase sigma factor (sigma-70 family)